MSFFKLPVEGKEKTVSEHPWARSIKSEYVRGMKYAHNSANNIEYPKPKEKPRSADRTTFTVIGNRVTKEFIYCSNLVKGMHKYRSRDYATPVIRGCTGVEWSNWVLKELRNKYGELAYCFKGPVAVIRNNKLLGGEEELKELIGMHYVYHLALHYQKESMKQFAAFIRASGRPCAYLHISVDEKPIGSLIFMLYADIVPQTCENFLRLCRSKRGGYSGTPVHRIVKDGWIQCGGFGLKRLDMDCENFIVPNDKRGVLGMANAERHVDCSTQFFVLLQPNEWLNNRFVAFGQLIDGEETLKQIEDIETYYESPKADIKIFDAGVLNLECQDITFNKGACAYIDKHIDDLVTIGELFFEMLLAQVFLELEFKLLQKLEAENGEYGEAFRETVDDQGNYIKENIRATRRFMRKKEDYDDHSVADHSVDYHRKSTTSRDTKKDSSDVNNDFDVEERSYESEEDPYQHETPLYTSLTTSEIKQTKPYYLALTDVPYPGETDSNFDLKKFLKGDYCLESDLAQLKDKKLTKGNVDSLTSVAGVIDTYLERRKSSSSSSSDYDDFSEDLDSEDEREIRDYLSQVVDKVSFAISGKMLDDIANTFVHANPLRKKPWEILNDEEVRRLRMAIQECKTRENKKVSLIVEPWKTHESKIKRRPTGFFGCLSSIKKLLEEEEEEEEEEDEEVENIRWVSMDADPSSSDKIETKQTGYYPKVLKKLHELAEEEEDRRRESLTNIDKESNIKQSVNVNKGTVHIASQSENTEKIIPSRPTPPPNSGKRKTTDDAVAKTVRPSVLMRLYDETAFDDASPTLKEYKPTSEISKSSDIFKESPLLRKGKNYFGKLPNTQDDESLNVSFKKLSSDGEVAAPYDYYDQFKGHQSSIRSVEFAKTRPSLSVEQYQKKYSTKNVDAPANEIYMQKSCK